MRLSSHDSAPAAIAARPAHGAGRLPLVELVPDFPNVGVAWQGHREGSRLYNVSGSVILT